MNNQKSILFLLLSALSLAGYAQVDEGNYITFNDRRNVVHGVYLGLSMGYGEIEGEDTFVSGLKLAYVANQQFELGFLTKGLYSRQNVLNPLTQDNADLIAGYVGFHFEPIFFGKSRVSLSFPLFIGGGVAGYVDREVVDSEEDNTVDVDVEAVFVVEPGVNVLFNISRYAQIEAGIKYRFSSKIELEDSPIERINGFTSEIGIKLGIFNMGRNRYKKKLN